MFVVSLWNIPWKPWVNHLRPHQGYNWPWVARTRKISKDTILSFKEFFFEISLHLGFWSFEFRFWVLALRGWILDGRWFSEEQRSMIVWQMSLCWITCASPGLTILDPFKATSSQGWIQNQNSKIQNVDRKKFGEAWNLNSFPRSDCLPMWCWSVLGLSQPQLIWDQHQRRPTRVQTNKSRRRLFLVDHRNKIKTAKSKKNIQNPKSNPPNPKPQIWL